MSELIERVFKKVSELPESEQDAFAEWLLQLLEDDERLWDAQFEASADKLETLADRTLAEYAAGRSKRLDLANTL
jgi:hypothetical protein